MTDALDELVAAVVNDPSAQAAYEDVQERVDLLLSLVAARLHSNLSRKQVAEAIGTDVTFIAELEKGRVDARMSTLQRYARVVGCRIAPRLELLDDPV